MSAAGVAARSGAAGWRALFWLAVAAGVALRCYQLADQVLVDDEWHAVHKLLQSDAAGILAVALRRQERGRHDDALVLFEEAADRGVAPALTALGKLYDPDGFEPGKPFSSPDPRLAALYYRRAEQAGDTQASAPRARLKAYLEREAAGGNTTAADALREFWP